MRKKVDSDSTFSELRNEIRRCRLCAKEFGFEPQPVFWGNASARIVHISQAPSLTVHKTQRPFNDKSGQRLREDWYQISDEDFYNPDIFYITSIAHCYPGRDKSGGDRKPPKSCAEKWLARELDLLQPRLFLVVGNYAANFFFPNRKMSDLVFKDLKIDGVTCFVLPHPSPINIKWFLDNPNFEEQRLPVIRKAVKRVMTGDQISLEHA